MPVDQMLAPLVGPAHPYARDGIAAGQKNHRSGQVEVRPTLAAVAKLAMHRRTCLLHPAVL